MFKERYVRWDDEEKTRYIFRKEAGNAMGRLRLSLTLFPLILSL
jgi:hypothetical protein